MTRQESAASPPVVLTVAGSDSGGGAGVQADLKTIEGCGGFGTSAVTAVTAQNTTGVEDTHVLPVDTVGRQVGAVLDDFDVGAVKTGMLATAELVELVTGRVARLDAPAVVDPVMVAESGDRLLAREAEAAYADLVAEATLVTPNADEAAVLTEVHPTDEATAAAAGRELVEMGADAALVTGGHLPGESVVDVLVTGDGAQLFRHPRVDTDATHGSGCTLSAAVATHLADGASLSAAVADGIDLLVRAVRYSLDVGRGPGAVHHLVGLRDRAAHGPTARAVAETADRLADAGVAPLVPDGGTAVVGATPCAEHPTDTVAASVGRSGPDDCDAHGVRPGGSTRLAPVLLGAREAQPSLRFAVAYRHDATLSLPPTDVAVVEVDGAGTRSSFAAVESTVDRADGTPVAVLERANAGGAVDGEATLSLLATDGDELVESTRALLSGER